MRELFYESKTMKIYKQNYSPSQDAKHDSYEVFAVSGRNLDGWYDVGWNHKITYSDVYSRDYLGRTSTYPSYNRNSETGYALKMVLNEIERDKNK